MSIPSFLNSSKINMLTPVVSFDTNALRSAKEGGASFQLLLQLVRVNTVKVIISEIVLEERRTQWREQHIKNANESKKHLSALMSDASLPIKARRDMKAAYDSLGLIDFEYLSVERSQKFVNDNCFHVHKISLGEAEYAWKSYFSGSLPFKEVKSRGDIPDAHIVAAAISISSNCHEMLFVSNDKYIKNALEGIGNITIFDSIDDLMGDKRVVALKGDLDIQKKWLKLKSLVSDEIIKSHVEKFIEEYGDEILKWQDFIDANVPSDDNLANIKSYGIPLSLSVGDVEDWGGGFLRCRVEYEIEAELGFIISRLNVFQIPEWASITSGDFNRDHYFEAEGYRLIQVNVDVSIRIDLNALDSDDGNEIFDIKFEEDSLEISIVEPQ